jgi:hypothetical protein
MGNLGLPKEIYLYGNRTIILPVLRIKSRYVTSNIVRKGRIVAIREFKIKKYTTVCLLYIGYHDKVILISITKKG